MDNKDFDEIDKLTNEIDQENKQKLDAYFEKQKNKRTFCKDCNKYVLTVNFEKHKKSHDLAKEHGIAHAYECKFCGKIYDDKRKLGGHAVRCEKNPQRHVSNAKTSKTLKGKSKPKEVVEKITKAVQKSCDIKSEIKNFNLTLIKNDSGNPTMGLQIFDSRFSKENLNKEMF